MTADVLTLNISTLGQVFTPPHIVSDMLNLIQSTKRLSNPRFLEPRCGNGAFFENLPSNKIGIELDSKVVCDESVLKVDFF